MTADPNLFFRTDVRFFPGMQIDIWYVGMDPLCEPGVEAFFSGGSVTDNPYEFGTDGRLAWSIGYNKAALFAGSWHNGVDFTYRGFKQPA